MAIPNFSDKGEILQTFSQVVIDNKLFYSVVSSKYQHNVNDSAVLTIKLGNYRGLTRSDIPIGARVIFQRGYNENDIVTRFVGYIESVSERQPFEIVCADRLRWLYLERIEESTFRGMTDKEIIQYLLDTTGSDPIGAGDYLLDFQRDPHTFSSIIGKTSKRLWMSFVSKEREFNYYMKQSDTDEKLVVTTPYEDIGEIGSNNNFITKSNIVLDGYNINDIKPEAVKVVIYITYTDSEKTDQTVEKGTGKKLIERIKKDIEIFEAEQLAQQIIDENTNFKLSGSFVTWGKPIIFPNEKITLEISDEKIGLGVDRVEETTGLGGIRQTVFLKSKVE